MFPFKLAYFQITWSTSGIHFRTPLFLVYINDLPLNIKEAKLVLYAAGKDEEDLQAKVSSVTKQLEVSFFNNDLIVNSKQLQ